MATSGAMADFARMPAQRKVLVFVVIGLLIGLVYWKIIYKALDDDLEAAQAEHDDKVRTNRRLAQDLPSYAELRTHMAKLHELIEKNQAALPSEAELPAFFEALQQRIAESGVEMHRWSNRSEEAVESFVKVPIEIEITGTFMQIKRFFASLLQPDVRPSPAAGDRASEVHDRIVSIENLALGSPIVKNREIVLFAKFTAVTFRQDSKPAAPDKGPNGQPAAAAPAQSRPPAAPPPPPLPSPPRLRCRARRPRRQPRRGSSDRSTRPTPATATRAVSRRRSRPPPAAIV